MDLTWCQLLVRLAPEKRQLSRSLQKTFASTFSEVFLDRFEKNPCLVGDEVPPIRQLDRSQRWFLNEYARFISRGLRFQNERWLFDQDPSAVSLVYSAAFFRKGILSSGEFEGHLRCQLEIEQKLAEYRSRRAVIFLDASVEALRRRSLGRRLGCVSIEWIAEIRNQFHSVYRDLDNVIYVDTTDLTIDEMVAVVDENVVRVASS